MPDLTAIPMAVWWGLSGASVAMFVGSLVVLRYVLIRMPADYFVREERGERPLWLGGHPVMRLVASVLKNVIGAVLTALGLVMLVTPGQGVLLIFVGVSLLDIPGKRAVELKLVGNPTVLKTINRVRMKAGRPPIVLGPTGRRDDRARSVGAQSDG